MLGESITSQADSHSVQRNERDKKKKKKAGHPPLRGHISHTLAEGDHRGQDAVRSRLSPHSFVFPPPYVHVAGLPPSWICSWRVMMLSRRR